MSLASIGIRLYTDIGMGDTVSKELSTPRGCWGIEMQSAEVEEGSGCAPTARVHVPSPRYWPNFG